MPSLTVENYCKAILQLGQRSGQPTVATGELAAALGVSPGTVTSMLKTLAESELAEYRPYEGVQLTRSGQSLALRLVRRHRLIELFLVRTLGLPWDQVHDEAENMEHAVSDALVDRIDEYLGRPDYDPHGEPIPAADGAMRGDETALFPLSNAAPGQQLRVARVLTQNPDLLRHLAQSGLTIGAAIEITDNSAAGGVVSLTTPGAGRQTLGRHVAAQLLVGPLDADR